MYMAQMYIVDPNSKGSPPVLFIHALGTDSSSWEMQMLAVLGRGGRPIAPDLPGFGKSPFSGGRWTIKKAAFEIKNMLDQMRLVKIPIVGISLGGAITLQFLLDYSDMVEKAMLVNTFACLRPKKIKELFYLGRRFITANLKGADAQAEMVAAHLFPREEQQFLRDKLVDGILHTSPTVYKSAMRQIALFDVRNRLLNIHTPVTVVSGENDKTVSPEIQNELASRIPGAKHVVIPDSGHAVIVDQVERFNQALLDFLY
jgi:pimeloyl-ACP methyl ester carboxylesterase